MRELQVERFEALARYFGCEPRARFDDGDLTVCYAENACLDGSGRPYWKGLFVVYPPGIMMDGEYEPERMPWSWGLTERKEHVLRRARTVARAWLEGDGQALPNSMRWLKYGEQSGQARGI